MSPSLSFTANGSSPRSWPSIRIVPAVGSSTGERARLGRPVRGENPDEAPPRDREGDVVGRAAGAAAAIGLDEPLDLDQRREARPIIAKRIAAECPRTVPAIRTFTHLHENEGPGGPPA